MKMETKTSKKAWYARDGGMKLRMYGIWAAGPGRYKNKKLEQEVNSLYENCHKEESRFFLFHPNYVTKDLDVLKAKGKEMHLFYQQRFSVLAVGPGCGESVTQVPEDLRSQQKSQRRRGVRASRKQWCAGGCSIGSWKQALICRVLQFGDANTPAMASVKLPPRGHTYWSIAPRKLPQRCVPVSVSLQHVYQYERGKGRRRGQFL